MLFYSKPYVSNKTTILFLKKNLPYMHSFDFDGFKHYKNLAL
jgi:hypothetical protein